MSERPNLYGMTPPDLAAFLRGCGVDIRDAEARRILGHSISNGRDGFPEIPVPKRVMVAVETLVDRGRPRVVERVDDPHDRGFAKYLFEAADGCLFEAVRIPLERPDRYSVCLSSQVGCAMRCVFCATGRLGLSRNLTAGEIVASFMAVRDEAKGRVSGAVFMGQGEPLANYDQVMQAARVLTDPCGGRIRGDAISVSTVGLVPQIRRYIDERKPYRLIVSLNSTVDERRARLMPVAARWSVAELTDAIREYAKDAAGGRVTVAWVVLAGINTGDVEVEGIANLLGDLPLRLNLIDVNDPRPDGFRKATSAELADFRDRLNQLGVPVVRRYSGGAATSAACGMLASKRLGTALTAARSADILPGRNLEVPS